MAKGSTFEADVLNLILCAKAISLVADNTVTTPLTALSVSLHTADPVGGTQGTNEVSFAGYTRQLTTRTTAGWTVTGSQPATASPVAAINFPTLTSTSTGVATHFGIGASSSTTGGKLYYSGTITPNINLGSGVTPQLTTGSSVTEL